MLSLSALNLDDFLSIPDSRLTRPSSSSTEFYFGPDVGMATCQQVQRGIDNFSFGPKECGAIIAVTRTTSDRCQCRDVNTGGACEPPPLTHTQNCDVCGSVGNNLIIGDMNKMIVEPGSMWSGTLCKELFALQKQFDFSPGQCSAAQAAAKEHCQCKNVNTPADQCLPEEREEYPCNPTNSPNCCVGKCRYRFAQGQYVCTLKDAQTPPSAYTPWWTIVQSGVRPSTSTSTCRANNKSCRSHSRCCSGKCLTGPKGYRICAGPNYCRPLGLSCTSSARCCSKKCVRKSGKKVCVSRSSRRLGESKALTDGTVDTGEFDEEEDADEVDEPDELARDLSDAEGSSNGMRRRHRRGLGRKIVRNIRDLV